MERKRRYHLSYTGNMGNCMLQWIIAQALMKHLGEGEVVAGEPHVAEQLAPWQIKIDVAPNLPDERYVLNKRVRSTKRTAKAIQSAGHSDIEIDTCNIFLSQYPPLAEVKAMFRPPPGLEVPRFGPGELVISIRAGKILDGIHRDYAVPPISFYRHLVAETGLKPVFVGQIGNDVYSRTIREAFPHATYVPSVSPIADFETLRRASNIVVSVSTFSMLAALLSDALRIFMPLLGYLNPFQRRDHQQSPIDDPRYRFFIFPLFYMEPIEQVLPGLEDYLGRWREVSPTMLRAMQESWPRVKPALADALAVFDETQYLARHPDVGKAMKDGTLRSPRDHFAQFGYAEGRDPCDVDGPWYSKAYPLAAYEVGNGEFANFAQHYAAVGARRGYSPVRK